MSPIPARGESALRFVYYQPLEIDTGVGRYLYPLEDGGTDEMAKSFWVPNTEVQGTFSVDLELKSAWPIADLRVPGFENEAEGAQGLYYYYLAMARTLRMLPVDGLKDGDGDSGTGPGGEGAAGAATGASSEGGK